MLNYIANKFKKFFQNQIQTLLWAFLKQVFRLAANIFWREQQPTVNWLKLLHLDVKVTEKKHLDFDLSQFNLKLWNSET
jgi:hypothetical protein